MIKAKDSSKGEDVGPSVHLRKEGLAKKPHRQRAVEKDRVLGLLRKRLAQSWG